MARHAACFFARWCCQRSSCSSPRRSIAPTYAHAAVSASGSARTPDRIRSSPIGGRRTTRCDRRCSRPRSSRRPSETVARRSLRSRHVKPREIRHVRRHGSTCHIGAQRGDTHTHTIQTRRRTHPNQEGGSISTRLTQGQPALRATGAPCSSSEHVGGRSRYVPLARACWYWCTPDSR